MMKDDLESSNSINYQSSQAFSLHFHPPIDDSLGTRSAVLQHIPLFSIIFVNFLSSYTYSSVIPSLPSMANQLGTDAYWSGFAISAYSLGMMMGMLILGKWSDGRRLREVIVFSLALMVVSNVWYALCTDFYQACAARFIVGFAAANFAPATSYLCYSSSPHDRPRILAWNSAASLLGVITGYVFASVTSIPQLSFSIPISIYYTLYYNGSTSPSWVCIVMAVIGLVCLIPFQEVPRPKIPNRIVSSMLKPSIRSVKSFSMIGQTSMPFQAIVTSLSLVFAYTVSLTVLECIGPIYVKDNLFTQWTQLTFSLFALGASSAGFTSILFLHVLLSGFNNPRKLMIFFNLIFLLGMLLLFDWEGLGTGFVDLPRLISGSLLVVVSYSCGQAMYMGFLSKLSQEKEEVRQTLFVVMIENSLTIL
eukprot:TRINITY_DN7432_c0_g1_i1.p1 TRINITY_DN7432_c0_g1~~TRINITY_DN7432_c0_g1_i1.p1  ORF type:complete len:420 (-),score=19.51 TRINITY_DN7432_c0_g1_i1:338-1597(-)